MPLAAPVRFGLIGYGAWGAHHARAIGEAAGAELVAICARSQASQERARDHCPDVLVYADYRQMMAEAEIDVVDVVLPSDLHFEVGRAAIEAGRHLFLEKPMALTVEHCDALIALAEARGRMLAVGHEFRLSSLWGKMKELIDSGAIGEPLYALIELWRRPYRQGSDGWRYDIRRVGNWVLEEPIHFFDLARWFFSSVGDPTSVYAAANGRQPGHPELHDNFSAVLKFPQGRYAVISQTLAAWEHHQTVKLTGTQAAMWARWSGALDRTFEPTFGLQLQEGDRVIDIPIAKLTGEVYELVDQIETVVRAVRGDSPPHCQGVDGRWSVAMCLAAQRSIEQGVPVSLAGGLS
ncbi:MAG TPA: Gfo/Idh/MocA family oxidoreductase [Pirellulales bacterium]|jgi:myo-inositol 2-dehydrogenase/D-chiro-inositol 1-dehydrogenase|nr:Gfo/Idh/MocA family oxidoreductase [Pirellulales bacterium]